MPDQPSHGDAFGELLTDHLQTGAAMEIIERDDGFITATTAARYFDEVDAWPALDIAAVGRCHGRVLDVGAGAGRASLELQQRGHDVLALDTSPGAAQICQRRGVPHAFTGTVYELADTQPERFDTILLLGNNLGLLETPQSATRFLAALAALSAPNATLAGTGSGPRTTQDPVHLRYHQLNRAAGRPTGQLRLRVRHRAVATPWFNFLLLAPHELELLLKDTDWRLADIHSDGAAYLAVLAKR
jgi:SAM-dependent methyltransferase